MPAVTLKIKLPYLSKASRWVTGLWFRYFSTRRPASRQAMQAASASACHSIPATAAGIQTDKTSSSQKPNLVLMGVAMMVIFALILASRRLEYFFFSGALILALQLIKRDKEVAAALLLTLGICWVLVYKWAASFLKNLGTDSFSETQKFDWNEAMFFLSTLRNDFEPNISLPLLLLSCISVFIIYIAAGQVKIEKNSRKKLPARGIVLIGAVLIALPTYWISKNSIAAIINSSEIFQQVSRNFSHLPPAINFARDIKLVVYIGESTSIMNMGLYGYPRNTTPELSELQRNDPSLLVFRNVFSTHTHTSPSLLEALSIALHEKEQFLPIYARQRISIVDILNRNNVRSFLFSNQGQTGTYNLASSIIFKNSERNFSTESRYLGNRDDELQKPADHAYFLASLQSPAYTAPAPGGSVFFLHSYAGHGNYLKNIPSDFRMPVDQAFKTRDADTVVGRDASLIESVEAYDSAIKYIDYSVARNLEVVRDSKEPAIFLYFADHGDSAYSGRGHDSSRFVHEMLRVPFILYFNDAARSAFPDLFAKYAQLASTGNVATLAQLPATIFDLLGGQAASPALQLPPIIGQMNKEIRPILVRKTHDGIGYIDLNRDRLQPSGDSEAVVEDMTDEQTAIFVATRSRTHQASGICYQQANSIGKVVRGTLVADCLEVDVAADDNGRFHVRHDPEDPRGPALDEVIGIAQDTGMALWLDAKGLTQGKSCSALARQLEPHMPFARPVYVELRSPLAMQDPDFMHCLQSLKRNGFRASYHVATDRLLECEEAAGGAYGLLPRRCTRLATELRDVAESGLFTDVSFNHVGLAVMQRMDAAAGLHWNIKNLTPDAYARIPLESFGMAMLAVNDPNSR